MSKWVEKESVEKLRLVQPKKHFMERTCIINNGKANYRKLNLVDQMEDRYNTYMQ